MAPAIDAVNRMVLKQIWPMGIARSSFTLDTFKRHETPRTICG